MTFYSIDYFNNCENSILLNNQKHNLDDIDINRIRSAQSDLSCFFQQTIIYYPSNKKMRRQPFQIKEFQLPQKKCVDPLWRFNSLGYAKIESICKFIFGLSCPIILFSGLIQQKPPFFSIMVAIAALAIPILMQKIALLAAKKVIDTSENIYKNLNSIEQYCLYDNTIARIASRDLKYLRYDQIMKKYGKSYAGHLYLDRKVEDKLLRKVRRTQADIVELSKKIIHQELKKEVFAVSKNIKIDNFIESFEQLIKIFNENPSEYKALLGSFFYKYFDVFDSLNEILRIRITEKEGTMSKFHHFFIPKVPTSQENDFFRAVKHTTMKEASGVLNIKKENTSLKFWESFSSGQLKYSDNINDLLEIIAEAQKYNAPFLLNKCLEEIKQYIDYENINELKIYGEDCQCIALVNICNLWLAKNIAEKISAIIRQSA